MQVSLINGSVMVCFFGLEVLMVIGVKYVNLLTSVGPPIIEEV